MMGRGLAPWIWALALSSLAVVAGAGEGGAQLLLTQEEALRLAFPEPAHIERRTAFLGEEDLREARALAGPGVEIEDGVISYYVGIEGDTPVGAAYFDVHRVRTLPEVLMVVIGPDDRVERIEVVKFQEPPEYVAPEGWIEQIIGKGLSPALSLKGEIVNITGATLTAGAVTDAARRVLAYHHLIDPLGSERGR